MPKSIDKTCIEVPIVLRDRLARLRMHERQAMFEVVEDALDYLENALSQARSTALAEVLNGAGDPCSLHGVNCVVAVDVP